MPKRKTISDATVSELLVECRRHCCLCFYFDGLLERCDGQIAHVDRNPSNARKENLVWLCLKHHEEYDRISSTAKRLTEGEIAVAKGRLYDKLIHLPPESDLRSDESMLFFEVTIPGDLSDFTEAEQAEILQALGKLARVRRGVQLMYKHRGSIKLGIDVTEEEASRLVEAFEAGKLQDLGISEVHMKRVAYSQIIEKLKKAREAQKSPQVERSEVRFDAREVGSAIRECLGGLVRPRRLAVSLHFQGYSVPEIGRLLGWSPKKADQLVLRGLADLRECLGRKGIR